MRKFIRKVKTEKEFEAMLRQSERLEAKQCCRGYNVTIRIYRAVYGPVGVRCQCDNCGRAGKLQGITELVCTDGGAGTPVTERSLMRGIKAAVKEWNEIIHFSDKSEESKREIKNEKKKEAKKKRKKQRQKIQPLRFCLITQNMRDSKTMWKTSFIHKNLYRLRCCLYNITN